LAGSSTNDPNGTIKNVMFNKKRYFVKIQNFAAMHANVHPRRTSGRRGRIDEIGDRGGGFRLGKR